MTGTPNDARRASSDSPVGVTGFPAQPLAPEDRWLQRLRMVVLEQHERPVWREARQIVELLQEAGADAIRWPTIVWAVTFFGSKYLPKHSGAGGRDFVRELLDAAHGTGIKVVPYLHVGVMHRECFAVHPEWAARARDGSALRWKDLHYLHCVSNPDSMAAYCGAVGEVVANYDVPAVYFDGPVWYGQCYCHHCQAAFARRWGYPMPERLSWDDDSRNHYNEMRYGQVVAAMRRLEEAAGSDGSTRRVPVMFNTGMTHSSGRGNGSIPERVMAHAQGCLSTEVHRRPADSGGEHGSYLGIVETVRLGAALRRVALCYTPPGPFESLVSHDSLDTDLFGATYLALGGTPIIETARSFLFDRTGLPRIRALFERMERHAPLYYDATPVRHALVLYSRQTAEYCTQDDLAGRYAQHFAGAMRALSHGHQQHECLYDLHLCAEELREAHVLVLANAASLSDAQLDVIREYVRNGGGLVATGETSLYDEMGRRRQDFGLADLFGVSYRGTCPPDDYNNLQYREGDGYQPIPEAYLRWADRSHPIAAGMPEQLVPISDAWWVSGAKVPPDYVLTEPLDAARRVGSSGHDGRNEVEAAQSTVVAELFLPAGGAYGVPFTFPLGRPVGLIASTYGAGSVVYIATGATRHYARRGDRGLRVLLNNAVDWAAAAPRPFRVDGPATLLAHMTRLDGGYPAGRSAASTDTMALHFVNYTGNMHENTAHRVEWVAPLRDLSFELALPHGLMVEAVEELHAGHDLPFSIDVGHEGRRVVRSRIPELGVSETVVIRLAPDR